MKQILKWLKVGTHEPKKENEWDEFTNCICGKLNEWVILDAVYHHESKSFYYNQDTTLTRKLSCTHFIYPIEPPK